MPRRSAKLLNWAVGGAILALVLSVLALLLPPEMGGYNPWNDAHSVLHNIAAILVRVVVFMAAGAALGGAWYRLRHLNR